MNFNNNPYDDEYKEYIKKIEINGQYPEGDSDDCSCSDDSNIYVSCNLKVGFDTKNKIIYLCPGKFQYFTVEMKRGEVKPVSYMF